MVWVTLNSHQFTTSRTNSARPKVKMTKYMPRRRRVASPTTSDSSAPTLAATAKASR